MSNGNTNGVLLVAVRQSSSEIIQTGGVLMPANVNKARVDAESKYIMCCNEIGDAFLIGMIDKVFSLNGQCIIKINQYAEIQRKDVWQEHRTKIGFTYLTSPKAVHLYPGKINFLPLPGSPNNNGNGPKEIPIETKAKRIVHYPVQKGLPLDVQLTRINLDRAKLIAEKRELLHKYIDQMTDAQIDAIEEFLPIKE